ncbi:RNA methyltransferase [Ochrobactrum sp. Marseille-Q0166]|uniref:TrmH family RNA methyltransferase n=1 Tax=Ochrobactrum sp. Marseille-Q0166 TaxID=2761105 RepID=UPI0016563CC9|nr:RNA methyltransferase [Ochrobactrum sp. Marseille-Q0166]MBC8716957.1 RNA methyltransferase [Ochrobactrum sp. Marseille-Q0166]
MKEQTTRSHDFVVEIADSNDQRLAAYKNIREKDLVGRQQRFIAEGKVVLNVLFSEATRFETESLLILENRLNGLQDQLAHLPSGVEVYSVPQSVIDEVAGFHVHRGILAVGRRKPQPELADVITRLPETALVVVLCGISNHDNVGSIFRNAAAFEADCVFMDKTCCDPLYRKAIRVSVGATLKVPYFHGSNIETIVAELQAAEFNILALSPSSELNIYQAARNKRQALLLGTEGEGLPAHLLTQLTGARIPMSSQFDSLNVATASGIALSRFSKFNG